ncbi:MAG: PQQ-binding-like beta-propeller repeat protein [Isosphaeraceae bacterium]
MTRRLLVAWGLIALWVSPAWAQHLWPVSAQLGPECEGWKPAAGGAVSVPCPPGAVGGGTSLVIPHPYRTQYEPSPIPCGVPTRTTLARLGLERHWMAYAPLAGDERIIGISLSDGILFARSNKGYLHAFDIESGRPMWTARLGLATSRFTPPATNSFAVFVANLDTLYALDRNTGVILWRQGMSTLPSCPTTADEERVVVGLSSGKLYGYNLKTTEAGKTSISNHPIDAWNWQTAGSIVTRPLLAGKFIVFGSQDGKVYVAMSEEPTMLYRIATAGPIGNGFGALGTRTLLVPSADRNLYAIDLFTSKVLWTYPSAAPIQQEPLVSQNDVYIVNLAGMLTSVDPTAGSPKWSISTQGGPLITVGSKRIYLKSHDEDLFIVDRSTGQMLSDPRSTHERAGLNLRCFEFNPTNRFNDRLYFANTSGLILALREAGTIAPTPHRDPKQPPFGTIPQEGVSLVPRPAQPPAEPAPGAEGAVPAPDGAMPAPGENAPPPEGDKPGETNNNP